MERNPRKFFYSKKGVLCEWLGDDTIRGVETGNIMKFKIDASETVFYSENQLSAKVKKITMYGHWNRIHDELRIVSLRRKGELK